MLNMCPKQIARLRLFLMGIEMDHRPKTTHARRAKAIGAQVNFSEDMMVCTGKEAFLTNESNKQRFIQMLSEKLERNGCTISMPNSDADLLIVQTAEEYSHNHVTTVVC